MAAQQMSLEELQEALRQAQDRADAAELERQQERDRADAAVKQIRPTTLEEYVSSCHTLVFSRLVVRTNMVLTSRGSIPSPQNKWCPTNLCLWPGFLEKQRSVYSTLYETFPLERRVFPTQAFLAGLGDYFSTWRIADEKMLESFLHMSVEDPVKRIINQLNDVEEARAAFNLGAGISFENHPHAISDIAEEVHERTGNPSTPLPPATPGQAYDLDQLRPDQICIYKFEDGESERRTMAYVCEYKPPHKLTTAHLRRGLHPMNIYRDVVNRSTVPLDDVARFQCSAEKLVASAITQTYHYMLEGGLDYGLLTTGEAIVFLKIDWENPETLYYHATEPAAEVPAHPGHPHLCTAVSQYLAFTLMALESLAENQHGQEERTKAMGDSKTWTVDFEMVLHSLPKSDRVIPNSDDDYQPEVYETFDRSPSPSQLRRSKRLRTGDDHPRENVRARDEEDSSDDEPRMPPSPSPAGRHTAQGQSRGGSVTARRSQRIVASTTRGTAGSNQDAAENPYCTQKCLLGLVDGGLIDQACPNAALHSQQHANNDRHPVSLAAFLGLLRGQLANSLDAGIRPLGIGGARGVLFKVTLLEFGYTFVSKGTVRAFVKDLEHEAAVYARLKPVQGTHVPVFLGAIDLRTMGKTYYYDHRVYVIHLSFMSWGGTRLDTKRVPKRLPMRDEQLRERAVLSLQAIHGAGVVHKDVREANMLFNAETDGIMVIDFERAVLVQPPRLPLALIVSPAKRRRSEGAGQKPGHCSQPDQLRDLLRADTLAVSELFK